MKVTGKTDEFIELLELEGKESCAFYFENPEPSSLTVIWFLEDENELLVDGKRYLFDRNQIVFFTEFHKVETIKKGKIRSVRFNRSFYCIVDHDVEVSCKGVLFFGASQLPIVQVIAETQEHFETLWRMFCIEMKSQDNLQISMLQMMLKRLLILNTRLYKSQQIGHQSEEVVEMNLVREFNYLVENHFREKHTVAEYADLLHKSPKTIANVFAKLGSKTPLSYIQDRKMLEARRLLYYTDRPIQEISAEIGYQDIQAFSRFFKKKEGISPSKYREKGTTG